MAQSRRKRRRIQKKQQSKKPGKSTKCRPSCISKSVISATTPLADEDGSDQPYNSSCYSTPKAKRFRIPELLTCPPAPKKRRVSLHCSAQKKSSISFFTPPDLEVFFLFALQNVSV